MTIHHFLAVQSTAHLLLECRETKVDCTLLEKTNKNINPHTVAYYSNSYPWVETLAKLVLGLERSSFRLYSVQCTQIVLRQTNSQFPSQLRIAARWRLSFGEELVPPSGRDTLPWSLRIVNIVFLGGTVLTARLGTQAVHTTLCQALGLLLWLLGFILHSNTPQSILLSIRSGSWVRRVTKSLCRPAQSAKRTRRCSGVSLSRVSRSR